MPVETIASVAGVKYTNGDGYYFRLSQKLNRKLYLNCQVKSCQVRGNLPQDYSEKDEIRVRGEHSHPPDFFELEFCEAEHRILERAARDPKSLRKIFAEETANVSPKTVCRLNYPSFLRRMQRRRQQDVRRVSDTLDDFSKRMQTSEYQNFAKIDGKKFFISAIKNHSILFISPTMKELLRCVDQTYVIYQAKKIISHNMKNVLIISQIHLNVAFPIVYIAMQHRSLEAYIDVFRKIKEEEPLWNPFTFFMNREESLLYAIQKIFPKCEIIPSWFHLVQELRKEIKVLELNGLLHSDPDFYNCVELLQGIPLLPPEFMNTGFEIVKNTAPALMTQPGVVHLYDFISENWLIEPICSQISLFEKTERLKAELKLMHRQFMSSFRASTRREVIWSFTKGIVTFEKKYADAYREILVSDSPPKWTGNSSCRSQEKKIHSLMELFSEAKLTIESFLEQFVRTGVNIMDLSDEDVTDISDEENPVNHDIENEEHRNTSNDECADFDDFIVEEIEEYSESEDTVLSPDQMYSFEKTKNEEDVSNIDRKRNHSFDEGDAEKKFREDAHFIEHTLVFPSNPIKQMSIADVTLPHACVECKKSTYSFACQPCGHLCLCCYCSKKIVQNSCPMCSKKVLWAQEIVLATPLDYGVKFEVISTEAV